MGCRWVADVTLHAIWVALSPKLRGRVHALDASDGLAVLRALPAHFPVGKPLRCRVARVRCIIAGFPLVRQVLVVQVLRFAGCSC